MVTVQLHDSVAALLTSYASQEGLTLEAYLARLALRGGAANGSELSDEEMEQQLRDLSLEVSPLPADFSRSDIYLDHA
jgi:hypothetical protein